MQNGHHTSHNWGSSSTQQQQQQHYDSSRYSYSNQYIPTSTGNTPSSTFLALSQPNTPRPKHVTHDDTTTDDSTLSSQSNERVSNFALAQLATDPTQPQRLNDGDPSMFNFETGPTFTPTKQHLDIWNMDRTNGLQVRMHVKIDRGLFLAGQDWTCYRRNYFQVSATFDVHGISYLMQGPEVPCLVQTEQGQLCQVDYFSIGVRACVSGTNKKVDLIQHTAKRDKGPQMTPQPRGLRSGGRLHMAPVGTNHTMVTFERMQFKTATANNGKRRAAQQYYELVMDLYANTSTGTSFCVASCTSAPLVVRGRSPGHYADSNARYRGSDINPVMPYSRPTQGPSASY